LTPTDDAPEQEPAETPEPEATEEAEAPAEQPEAAAEQPAAEEAPADEPGAEEAPAEEAPAEEPAAEEAPAEETAEPAAEEAPAAEAPAAEEAPAEEAPAEETPAAPAAEGKKDVVPGANLEPIAITEERELTAEERAALEAEEEERASREAAANADEDELPRRTAVAVPADATIQATGKRKSSVARVVLRAGDGNIEVNGRAIDDYFPRPHHQSIARQPLVTAGYEGNVDVKVRVHGGGVSGQAGAVRHGLARALTQLDPELRGDLKKRGMLTRDARAKERRKAGLKKARKKPQFSKR
jgi:small subunit ribosomal protein S9